MHQRSPDHCGSFTADDILQLKKTLKQMEQNLMHHQSLPQISSVATTAPKRVRSNSMDSECSDVVSYTDHTNDLLSWRGLKRVCRKNSCGVDSNLLVSIPRSLYTHTNLSRRSEFTIEFLMEELVRLSSAPSSAIENCVCKVGHAFSLSLNVTSCLNAIHEAHSTGRAPTETPPSLYANITDQASAVYVSVPAPNPSSDLANVVSSGSLKVVVGCEHMIHKEKVASGCTDYFLVGGDLTLLLDLPLPADLSFLDESHWLYFATLIFKGSDYPQGSRELFQSGEDCPLLSSSDLPFPLSLSCDRSMSDPGTYSNPHHHVHKIAPGDRP
jgi:hypothetical protein